jgi:hypothetical protein
MPLSRYQKINRPLLDLAIGSSGGLKKFVGEVHNYLSGVALIFHIFVLIVQGDLFHVHQIGRLSKVFYRQHQSNALLSR